MNNELNNGPVREDFIVIRLLHSLGLGSLDPVTRGAVTTGDCQAAVDDQDSFSCYVHALERSATLDDTAFTTY